MRVLLDGTPLLGRRTGIGRYTASLAQALAAHADVRLIGFTMRGWRDLRTAAPAGTRASGVPVPARVLRACWTRGPFPPIELFAGTSDVVHGTNFVLPPTLGASGVVTIHDLAFLHAETAGVDPELPRLVRTAARRAAVICTPTETVAESVATHCGVERSKIAVTPLGVDTAWFDAPLPDAAFRSRLGLPDDYLLFIGDDGPRKGLPTLMRALDAELPQLVLAGPGERPWHESVVRTGYLADSELRSVVAGARALVLPSRDEGFGLPVLEALACGVPVVCSDIPALREVGGSHAIFFERDDSAALRAALHRAVASSGETRAAGRAHAATYTWQNCAETTLAAYRSVTS